jgi:hypothetical protein
MPRGSRKFPASGARALLRCGVEEKTRTVLTIDEVISINILMRNSSRLKTWETRQPLSTELP